MAEAEKVGPLKNLKHERFAQEVAAGCSATEAYERAGYRRHEGNAARLRANERVARRIDELVEEATQKALAKLAITKERVLQEYARIGFADLRRAVEWEGHAVTEEDNPDGGEVLVIRHIHSNLVKLKSAADLDDDIAAAIAEVSQNKDGAIRIKLHPKLPALDALADHLGLKRPQKIEHTGKDGGPIKTEDVSALDVLESRLRGIKSRNAGGPAGGSKEGGAGGSDRGSS